MVWNKNTGVVYGGVELNLACRRGLDLSKVLCIEIGNTSIKVCETDHKKKHPKLYQTSIWETPEKMFEDGYIRDKNGFAEFVKEQMAKEGYRQKNIIFTIQSNKILTREITIPLVKENRIAAVMAAQANEYFPKDIKEYIVTYVILNKNPEKKEISLMAYAAPSSLIKHYYSLAELMGLNIMGIDFIGNSSYQWFKKKANTDTEFVLQIKEDVSFVTIMQNGILTLQRTIPYGGIVLYQQLQNVNSYRFDQSKAAATVIPFYSMTTDSEGIEKESDHIDIDGDDLLEHAIETLSLFINQVERILEYYTSRLSQSQKQEKIKKISLLGGGAVKSKIKEFIEKELQIPVVYYGTEISMNVHQEVITEQMETFLGCIGASYGAINFVPKDYIELAQKREFWKLYLGLLLAAILAGGVLVNSGYLNYQKERSIKKELEVKIALLSGLEPLLQERNTLKEAEEALEIMDASTYRSNEELNDLIHYLEDKLPSSAVIQSFTSTTEGITASITTDSKESAAKLLLQLQTIPYIADVKIAGITEVTNEEFGTKVITFSVTCIYQNVKIGGSTNE